MTYTEDWYSLENQKALADAYEQVRDLEGDVVEVGCWEGRSTVALANACYPQRVHAVDTWEGSPGEISADLAQQRDVHQTFTENMTAETAGNVNVFRMDWRDYFTLRQEPVKFCHIDATHTYSEVRDNIRTVLRFIVPGGVICGDDAHHPPVYKAVLDTLGLKVQLTGTNLWTWRKP